MTPEEENKIRDWYAIKFAQNTLGCGGTVGGQLLEEQAADWERLKIWDGQKLVPAMPAGFHGTPSLEQQARIYQAAHEGNLFLYRLGEDLPCQYDGVWNEPLDGEKLRQNPVQEPVKPVEPEKFQQPEPKLESYTAGLSKLKLTLNKWFGWLGVCRGEKRKLDQRTQQFNDDHRQWAAERDAHSEASDRYLEASKKYRSQDAKYQTWRHQMDTVEKRGPELEAALQANRENRQKAIADGIEARERVYREKSAKDRDILHRLDGLDRTLDSIFAPRPKEISPVVTEKYVQGNTLSRKEFNEIAAHGYDLPENSKVTPREAAVINLALAGAPSVTMPAFQAFRPLMRPDAVENWSKCGYNMLITGAFGLSRNGQNLVGVHAAFDKAKEAIQAYQDGKPEALGRYLGEGLRNLVNGLGDGEVCGLNMTAGGLVAKRFLEVLDNHPDLKAHCGLSPDDELDARGFAALSEISLNGMNARMLLEQADAGIRELSSEEKGRCLADLALLEISKNKVETEIDKVQTKGEEDNSELQKDDLSELRKAYHSELQKAMERDAEDQADTDARMKDHADEIEADFQKYCPDVVGRISGLRDKHAELYGQDGASMYLVASWGLKSICQRTYGKKGALAFIQNQYRSDPTIRDEAAGKTPREILDLANDPVAVGRLVTQSALGQQGPVNAPVQANQRVSAPVKQQPQKKQPAAMGKQ